MKNNIHGVGVALVTPFTPDYEVDYNALGCVVDHVVSGGVDYLVALGTTAETPTLSSEEKGEILRFIKLRNAGRLPLIVGIGGNGTASVAREIEDADLEGVAAVLSVTPYYNKPTQQGLFEHYKVIAGASPVPILLYNVPGRTGVNMLPETTVRIARQVDNILGIKEACGNLSQMCHLLKHRPDGFKVISGDDAMILPLNHVGGDGVISVVANAFPREFVDMCRLSCCGDIAGAASLNMKLFEIIEAIFKEGNPSGVKAAMNIKGLLENILRLPLVPASEKLTDEIRGLMSANGI